MNCLTKKKKPVFNAFGCFLVDFRQKQKDQGIYYENMVEISQAAQPFWERLSKDEKEEYKVMARNQKAQHGGNATKYTSQGISFEELDRQKMLKEKAIKEMEQTISSMVQTAYVDKTLLEKEFYFISSVFFCQTIHGDIFPAELGLVKFSLNEGIVDSVHMYINPGKLPLGFSCEAQEVSENTHKLKIPPNARGLRNYRDIQNHILNFLNAGDSVGLPVVFTNSNEIKTTVMVLNKIWKECENSDFLKIYGLENLLCRLKEYTLMMAGADMDKVQPVIYSKIIAKDIIDRDPYAYSIGLGCKFHDDEDRSFHCVLSKVKRWCFIIADHCNIRDMGIEFIPGKHIPDVCELVVTSPSDEIWGVEEDVLVDVNDCTSTTSKIVHSWEQVTDDFTERYSKLFIVPKSAFKIPEGCDKDDDISSIASAFSREHLVDHTKKPSSTSSFITGVGRGRHIMFPRLETELPCGRGGSLNKLVKQVD